MAPATHFGFLPSNGMWHWPATKEGTMVQRSVLWPKLPGSQAPPRSPDPSLAQEDPETRIAVAHYLVLADFLLSTNEPTRNEESDEAA
jgi:hypothetical protein